MKITVDVVKKIHESVLKGVNRTTVMKEIGDVIKDVPNFSLTEKKELWRIYNRASKLMYVQDGKLENQQIKRMSTDVHKVFEHRNSVMRIGTVRKQLKHSRAKGEVFYLSSSHSNPAPDHKAYEGKIYVDKFWRDRCSDEDRPKIAAYIKNHGTLTVQDVMYKEPYLVTRPYCKHYFVSVRNDEVLKSSVNKIKKLYPLSRARSWSVDYLKTYYSEREKLHLVMGMKEEAFLDRFLIQRHSTGNRIKK